MLREDRGLCKVLKGTNNCTICQEMLGATVEVTLERMSDASSVFLGKSQNGGLEIESMEEGGMSLLQK